MTAALASGSLSDIRTRRRIRAACLAVVDAAFSRLAKWGEDDKSRTGLSVLRRVTPLFRDNGYNWL